MQSLQAEIDLKCLELPKVKLFGSRILEGEKFKKVETNIWVGSQQEELQHGPVVRAVNTLGFRCGILVFLPEIFLVHTEIVVPIPIERLVNANIRRIS